MFRLGHGLGRQSKRNAGKHKFSRHKASFQLSGCGSTLAKTMPFA